MSSWRGPCLAVSLVATAGCGVDSYLTCGASCADGGSGDATLSDSSTNDGGGNDAGAGDAGCKGDGGSCLQSGDCCSSACSQSNRCVTSCASQGGSCATSSACCVGFYCADGGCAQCFPDNTTCTVDSECCSDNCSGGFDGGPRHCSTGGGGA